MEGIKQYAIQYLDRCSIIPVGGDKKPLINWKEFQERKPTKEEVEEWLKKWPDMNIAIVTGKISDFAVVDIEKGGSTEGLPTTIIAKTGGGGYHYYYQYVEGIENKSRIRPLTDIRGEGGYVIAPPSLHKSGNRYEWINPNGGFAAPFPKHLFGVKEQKWDEVANGIPEGQRNETASRYIGKLMSIFSPDTWESTVWETVRAWNEKNTPPMNENELRRTYESIKRRAIKNPRSETVRENVKWITLSDLMERSTEELLNTKPEDVVSFGYEWLDDQMTGLFPSELVILGGESGSGKTTFATNIIYKASQTRKCAILALEDRSNDYGIKKTYFEIGRIRTEQGMKNYPWNVYRKNIVEDRDRFQEEIDEAKKRNQNENVSFLDIEKQIDIELLEEIIEEQVNNGVELFLIDHLHYFDLLKGNNNKSDYIEQVMVRLKTLQNRTGARIIMVVHYKKLEGAKPKLDSFKDSISIVQNANYVINLYRPRGEDVRPENRYLTTIYIPKSRNPNGEGVIEVIFNPDTNDYEVKHPWNDERIQLDSSKEVSENDV